MIGVVGNSSNNGPLLMRVCIAMMCISALGITLRLTARRLAKEKFWWDDWVILLAFVVVWALTVTHIIAVKIGGLGQHISILTSPSVVMNCLKLLYTAEILYAVAIASIKWSILVFYRRIFPVPKTKIPVYIIGTILGAWPIASVISTIFSCKPVDGFWDKALMPKCNDNWKFSWPTATLNIATDIALLIFPIPIIWKLQLPTSHKISLTGIFAIGGFITVISSLRLVAIIALGSSKDITYVLLPVGIFNVIETNCGIFLACLPSMALLLRIAIRKAPIKFSSSWKSNSVYTSSRHRFRAKKTDASDSLIQLYEPSSTCQKGKTLSQLGTIQTNVKSEDIELAGLKRSPGAEGNQVTSEIEWEY